jgi:uncharacterized protein YoxC
MDHELVSIFNHVGLGTFFLVAGFIVASIIFIIKNTIAITKKYKQKVIEDVDKTESLSKLEKSVDNLNTELKKLNNRLNCTDAIINKLDEANRVNTRNIRENTDNINNIIMPSLKKADYVISDVIKSNNAAIRSFIVNEYHKWMKLGYIDIYSFYVIQDRYEFYSRHNGNTFVKSLVEQLDKLPVKSVVTDENGKDPVSYFTDNPSMHPHLRHKIYQEKYKDGAVKPSYDDMQDNYYGDKKIGNIDAFTTHNIDEYYDNIRNNEAYTKQDEE